MNTHQKTVILAMHPAFGIYQTIADNLRRCGFDVTEIVYQQQRSPYLNPIALFKKLYYKHTLSRENYQDYKKEQIFLQYSSEIMLKLNRIQGQADYCFMIWPGMFPYSFLKILRAKSKMMVHYNWEALDFLEYEFDKIQYFDKFLFFDPYDIGKHPEYAKKLIPITSFWLQGKHPAPTQSSGSLFFIGTHHRERVHDIRQFYQAATEIGIPIDFHMAAKNIPLAKQELGLDIHYFDIQKPLSYGDNLKKAQEAGILVDFLHSKHHGLSLRIFESIGFDKKLITTNPTITHYDFYRPDNMFVWRGDNIDALKDFLRRPYQPLPEDLKHKYSFDNWINYVFDIQPNIPITLPEISPDKEHS